MMRNGLQILACFALVGLALLIAYRATEPAGDGPTPTPADLRGIARDTADGYDQTLASLAESERKARRALKPGDWQSHFAVLQSRMLYLRVRRLKDTNGADGEVQPDPEMRRLLALMRRYARTEEQRSLTEQLARGNG